VGLVLKHLAAPGRMQQLAQSLRGHAREDVHRGHLRQRRGHAAGAQAAGPGCARSTTSLAIQAAMDAVPLALLEELSKLMAPPPLPPLILF